MALFENPDQLRQLQDLLYPNRNRRGGNADSSSDSEDEGQSLVVTKEEASARAAAAASGKAEKAADKGGRKKKVNLVATPLKEDNNAQPITLEAWQEAQEREDADILETRKCPEYTMTYRQAVGTEDVFLQMGQRTGASASCEDLVLEISLPDETMEVDKMSLKLHEKDIDLGTSLYRLKLPLPHAVDVNRCHAKYDSEQRKMRLTLRLRREFDYVNF